MRGRWSLYVLLGGAVHTTVTGLIGDNDVRVTHGLLLLILAAIMTIGLRLIDDRSGGDQ